MPARKDDLHRSGEPEQETRTKIDCAIGAPAGAPSRRSQLTANAPPRVTWPARTQVSLNVP